MSEEAYCDECEEDFTEDNPPSGMCVGCELDMKERIKELEQEVIKWKRIRRPAHGPCCTCQACGLHYDDCRCDLDDIADDLKEKEYVLLWLDSWTEVCIDKYTRTMKCSSYLPIVPDVEVSLLGDQSIVEYVKEGYKQIAFGSVGKHPEAWKEETEKE